MQRTSYILITLCCLLTRTAWAADVHPIHTPPFFVPIITPWWAQLGGSSTHTQIPHSAGQFLSIPDWSSIGDGQTTLTFTPQAGVVADDERAYAVGYDQQFNHHLTAFDQDTGDLAWTTQIPLAILDSWSTPTIDQRNETIIVATGFFMLALDRFSGDQVWSTEFDLPLVNASPCLTDDLENANRVFITDYSFSSGTNGSLICINTDPFDELSNPFHPGQVVWSALLPGNCSGNTPAYHKGTVYVSTADDGLGGQGHVLAFDASGTVEPTPFWDTRNSETLGFYGGVTYSEGHIYASSYNFNGLQRSANTIKLNAITGDILWSVPTVRTDASPVILPDGNIIVSGGVPTSPATIFTGSLPAIELIEDLGTSAILLWDSFEATHVDLNDSGTWDQGEPFLSIGGWGHHPVAFKCNRSTKLLVGTMSPPSGFDPFSHASDLHTINLSMHPTEPGFIISTQPNLGGTPAIVGNRVFTTTDLGLSALTLDINPQPLPLIEHIRLIVDGFNPAESIRPAP